jgi:hypothetical protein
LNQNSQVIDYFRKKTTSPRSWGQVFDFLSSERNQIPPHDSSGKARGTNKVDDGEVDSGQQGQQFFVNYLRTSAHTRE